MKNCTGDAAVDLNNVTCRKQSISFHANKESQHFSALDGLFPLHSFQTECGDGVFLAVLRPPPLRLSSAVHFASDKSRACELSLKVQINFNASDSKINLPMRGWEAELAWITALAA